MDGEVGGEQAMEMVLPRETQLERSKWSPVLLAATGNAGEGAGLWRKGGTVSDFVVRWNPFHRKRQKHSCLAYAKLRGGWGGHIYSCNPELMLH